MVEEVSGALGARNLGPHDDEKVAMMQQRGGWTEFQLSRLISLIRGPAAR